MAADERKAKYHVSIETADGYIGAEGEHNLVILQMTGKDGRVTKEISLNLAGEPHFGRGERDDFDVEALDVGLPIIVTLELREHAGKNPWAVRHVEIRYNDQTVHFPVHDWIENNMSITMGHGRPYHKIDNAHVISMLKREVDSSKVVLPWIRCPGPTDSLWSLPRCVDATENKEMPLIFRPSEVWIKSAAPTSAQEAIVKAFIDIKKNSYTLNSLEDYELLYKTFEDGKERSAFLDRWKSDEDFGRQQLNGIAPTSLKRCTQLPKSSRITSELLCELLKGKTLEEEMEAGKIYIGDFSEVLKGVRRNKNARGEQLYCPDALCLFHVNSNDDLVPIAIQLVTDDKDSVFTPNDSELDWLLAKMYYKVAFSCMHLWYYHFLLTHGVMEPFSVGVLRGLPRCHPIYKLLRPHLQTLPVINLLARKSLILADSALNNVAAIEGEDLARHMFNRFDMEDLDAPCLLQKHGVMDKKLLPKFYYRDDSVELWEIINDFVTAIIRFYYPDDRDVCSDRFLQGMMEDIAEEGIGWIDKKSYKGVPHPMCQVDELIHLCTTVIFTSSVQHAAVNFPQYEIYKFVPNTPPGMRLPPHKKGEATMERIMNSLPDIEMSVTLIGIMASLSVYSQDEVFLGNYPMKLFTEDEPRKAIEKFQKDLNRFAKSAKKRNEKVEYAYDWLLPEKIPNSISI